MSAVPRGMALWALQRGRNQMQRLPCVTCGVALTTRDKLLAHQRHAYHGFLCLLCGAELTTRAEFDGHVAVEHPRPLLARVFLGRVDVNPLAARCMSRHHHTAVRADGTDPLRAPAASPTTTRRPPG